MKFISILLSLFLSTQAFAHTDHALGEGTLHTIYHIAFWTVLALVVVKGIKYYKTKNKKSDKV